MGNASRCSLGEAAFTTSTSSSITSLIPQTLITAPIGSVTADLLTSRTSTVEVAACRKPCTGACGKGRDSHRDVATEIASAPAPSAEFVQFAARLRGELAPRTLIEQILVDRVVLAAWRLDQLSRDELDRVEQTEGLPAISPETLQVECSLETALALLESARRLNAPQWGRSEHPRQPVALLEDDDEGLGAADLANEWPTLDTSGSDESLDDSCDDDDNQDDDEEDSSEPTPYRWQDRLVIDPNVSKTSPVVRGTWVTVSHVTSLVVDGWTWSDILRTHPELTEDDIRTCLAYTAELDDLGAY